jgi:CHAD domain-containing protein
MAFRLRQEESVAVGLRRLAKKELDSARDQLRGAAGPRDEAIHEARKSIKKVRAILTVIKADDGRGLAGCRKQLRKVNGTLSRLRDADAMLEILSKLETKHPHALDEHTYARIRRQLEAHKQDVAKAAHEEDVWTDVDRALRKLRKKAKWWQPTHRGFGAIAAGIDVTYRRGRKALARVRTHPRADDFHEWRKQMKALWYALRLVEACALGIRRDVSLLHTAERWLGDEHNAVVLCAQLSKDASLCDIEALRHAASRFQCELRQNAIARASRLYSRTPEQYLAHVKHAWKAWCRSQRGDTRHAHGVRPHKNWSQSTTSRRSTASLR